jgi:hypothetical protein
MIDHRGAEIIDVTPETKYDDVYRALNDEAQIGGLLTLRISEDVVAFGIALQAIVIATYVMETHGQKLLVRPEGMFGGMYNHDGFSMLVCSWAPKYEGEGAIQFDNVVLYDTLQDRLEKFEWEK